VWSSGRVPSPRTATPWLRKPRRSGGGHGIRLWRPGMPVPPESYLQERIDGVPGSLVFAADGRRMVPLGISRQLVGERAFGASGFRYCGNVLGGPGVTLFGDDQRVLDTAVALADAVTEEFGLVGLNGLDFIARDGVAYPIEVNPRYSASMELIERAEGVSMFEIHVRACRGVLPRSHPLKRARTGAVHGKAIVFAHQVLTVGNTRRWLRDGGVRDVPHPGERIARGRPICTVLAQGATPDACHAALRRRAATIYRALEPGGRSVA
jgi:uncharacterized protein